MLVLAFINELKICNSDIEKDISLEIEKMFSQRDFKWIKLTLKRQPC